MRISSDKNDPDYRPDLVGHVEVYLDGRKVSLVVMADDAKGAVRYWLTDRNGNPLMRPDGLGVETALAYGKVEIIFEATRSVIHANRKTELRRERIGRLLGLPDNLSAECGTVPDDSKS